MDRMAGAEPGRAECEALAEDLTEALVLVLERLPAEERIAYILCGCFGLGAAEVAPIVARTEEECRCLTERAGTVLAGGGPGAGPLPCMN